MLEIGSLWGCISRSTRRGFVGSTCPSIFCQLSHKSPSPRADRFPSRSLALGSWPKLSQRGHMSLISRLNVANVVSPSSLQACSFYLIEMLPVETPDTANILSMVCQMASSPSPGAKMLLSQSEHRRPLRVVLQSYSATATCSCFASTPEAPAGERLPGRDGI